MKPLATTKTAATVMCRPQFRIDCVGEEGPHSDMEKYGWVPSGDDMLYLTVKTCVNTWHCMVPRAAMNAVFEAINKNGVTIEFCGSDSRQSPMPLDRQPPQP
jgi:hypothetical protein